MLFGLSESGSDLRQVGGQHAVCGGRRSYHHHGPARLADTGEPAMPFRRLQENNTDYRELAIYDLISVPARHISEGAAPCPYCLAPCPIIQGPAQIIYIKNKLIFQFYLFFIYLQNVIAVFVISDSRCKNACNCLQICAHVFINRLQNCAKTSFRSRAGL